MSLIAEGIELELSPGTVFCTRALTDINLSLEPGQIVGLVGHTGSGKSSLLQVLSGLQEPTAGRVLLEGMPLYEKSTDKRILRRLVGVSFQYPEHQLFEETVERELAFGLKRQNLEDAEISRRIDEALALVQLDRKHLNSSPFELSGGQMRRVALAASFALMPRYLFLDEPVAGLDPRGRDQILRCIKQFRDSNNSCIVLVSHSMEDIAQVADRMVVLKQGRLLIEGATAQVFAAGEILQQAGLELPEAVRLVQALHRAGLELPEQTVITIDQAYELLVRILKEKQADEFI